MVEVNPAADMTDQQLFEKAASLYDAKEYDQAAALYQTIIGRGYESAAVYYNLGNTKFKAGDLGYAVLYYHRALRLDPGDEDIMSNLEFAKLFTTIQMEGVELNPVSTFFESLIAPYKLSLLAWVSSAFFIVLFGFLIGRYGLGMRGGWVKSAIVVSLVLLIVVGSLTTFKYNRDYLITRGVVVGADCPVLTGPSASLDVDFDAAPGLVVRILSESGDYYNVLFENKRRGWIQKQLIAVI
jgi:tetratricopeptide (TPR) repeat protein